jgi:Cu(I)/Ag(I) efflux system membrane protein CusA/SilA
MEVSGRTVRGRMNSMGDLREAVIEGAVHRVRPKVMTICAILFGLLPIMWSPTTQSGADVMKRIAAPMIGGVVTSGILELLLYPVIYVFWRKRHLPKATRDSSVLTEVVASAPVEVSAARPVSEPAKAHRSRKVFLLATIVVALAVGGYFAWQKFGHGGSSGAIVSGQPFATQKVKDLTVTFFDSKGQLQNAMNDILIEFRDTTGGELVDVGTVKFDLDMNMPGMVMHSGATIQPTDTPGQYRANVKPDMAGDWKATLRYDGPRGNGNVSFPLNVKP